MRAMEALKDLQRKYADRLRYSWPDEDVSKQCDESIKKIKSIFSNDVDIIDFNSTLQKDILVDLLQKYVIRNINRFTVQSIEQLSAWFSQCEIEIATGKYKLYQLSNIFILTKIFKLFKTVNVNTRIVTENLLVCYLNLYENCSKQFVNILISYVSQNIDNYEYYFSQSNFIQTHFTKSERNQTDYVSFLISKNINKKFVSKKYFRDMWFFWVMNCADVLTDDFLNNNIMLGLFSSVSLDRQKIILAYIAYIFSNNPIDNQRKKFCFENYLIPKIGKSNPLHKEFWIVDKELKLNYDKFLTAAPNIFKNYYVTEFISIFFDALESTGGDEERAIFWKKYKNKINKIAIALKNDHKEQIERYIEKHIPKSSIDGYKKILLDFVQPLQASKSTTPAVLILGFESIIVIEFSQIGNAMYIYRNNKKTDYLFFRSSTKNGEDDFKNWKSSSFLKKLVHRGDWQENFRYVLWSDFNIKP